FGRDFNRPAPDPTGTVQKLMAMMPLPNDFRFGEGLNTGGYTWKRRRTNDFNHYAVKIDHVINSRNRINFSFIKENYDSIKAFLPSIGGNKYVPVLAFAATPIASDNDPQGRIAPLYVFGDSFHWIRGKHEVKFGGETRFASSNAFSSFNVIPRVSFGVGDDLLGVIGVDGSSIPGLGPNEDSAQAVLTDRSGSVDNVFHTFKASGQPPA